MRQFILFLSSILLLSCDSHQKNNGNLLTENNVSEVNRYVQEQMKIHHIPGLSIAVIRDGEILFMENYGYENLFTKDLIDNETIFPIYSVTKLMVSIAAFKLIEEGSLGLEDQISKYIDNLPQEWSEIKIKHLLTHSSGLPDLWDQEIRKELNSMSDSELLEELIQRDIMYLAGDHWEYNQTGYWFLGEIVETIINGPIEEYILLNQFPDNNSQVLFSSDMTENIKGRAYFHSYDQDKFYLEDSNPGDKAHVLNGLNLSMNQLIEWNFRLDKMSLLNRNTLDKMWSEFPFDNINNSFLYGWDIYNQNDLKVLGFSGGGCSAYRKFKDPNNQDYDLTVILLSNGYKYYSVESNMVDYIAGVVDTQLINEFQIFETNLSNIFLEDSSIDNYYDFLLVTENQDHKFSLERIGNSFMVNSLFPQAIDVYNAILKHHERSSKYYNRLAASYSFNGDTSLAIKAYESSLSIDSLNGEALKYIDILKSKKNF